MKLLNPKPLTLSPAQSQVWDAVNDCDHSVYAIAKRSGVHRNAITRWINGQYEPKQFYIDCILQAITELNEKPKFKWKYNIVMAINMLRTKSIDEVADHFGATVWSVRSAVQYANRRANKNLNALHQHHIFKRVA